MSGVDVKLNKTVKKPGAVGRPKKVVKSPKKKSSTDTGDSFDYCPLGMNFLWDVKTVISFGIYVVLA